MSKKCPICDNKSYHVEIETDGYTEPPEHLYKCNICGFSEYSMYPIDSPIFSIESLMEKATDSSYLSQICEIEKYSLTQKNNFEKAYKEVLLEYLNKNNLTIQDLIENRKSYFDMIENRKAIKLDKLKKEKERLEKGLLTDKEKEQRKKFESDIKNTNKMFLNLGIVKDNNGLLEIDSDRSTEYSAEKFQNQKNYCKENGIPTFSSLRCFKCGQNIYGQKIVKVKFLGKEYEKVIENTSLLKASTTLITGCPCCSKSFVD